MTNETRERLERLWSKMPEAKPKSSLKSACAIGGSGAGFAMTEALAKHHDELCIKRTADKKFRVVVTRESDVASARADTLFDALLSACEAVAEERNL